MAPSHASESNGTPPARHTPGSRRSLLVRLGVIGLIAAGAALWVGGLFSYANHDRLELLDRPLVSDTAEKACDRLASVLAAADAGDKRLNLQAGDDAIQHLISTMRGLGDHALEDDSPAIGWLADWELIIDERQRLAENVQTNPTASFVMPQTPDGYPIARRMIRASGQACDTAITLATAP